MVFISATRLQLSSVLSLPEFILANEAATKQLKNTKGFLVKMELMEKDLTVWLVSMWQIDGTLRDFRTAIPHFELMKKFPHWCKDASFIHWTQREAKLPDWDTVQKKMRFETMLVKAPKINEYSVAQCA